jgi:hypothetical protein
MVVFYDYFYKQSLFQLEPSFTLQKLNDFVRYGFNFNTQSILRAGRQPSLKQLDIWKPIYC